MDIILNELSLARLPATPAQANQVLSQWLQLVAQIRQQQRVMPAFRTTSSLRDLAVVSSHDYFFSQWLSTLPREERGVALLATTKGPFVRETYPEYQFRSAAPPGHVNAECVGFAYAIEHYCLAWSLDGFGDWTAPHYELVKVTVDEDEIHEEELIAWHLPSTGLSADHQPFLENQLSATEQKILGSCRSGQDLLTNWTQWFTQLDLTPIAQKTLPQLPTAALPAVIRILIELQRFFSQWNGIPANYETALRYKATQESDSRLKAYAAQLRISCPDGETRLMNWHLRYTIGAGRLYFLPNEAQRRCFIGYAGIKIGAT